jgi:hypothetical protein
VTPSFSVPLNSLFCYTVLRYNYKYKNSVLYELIYAAFNRARALMDYNIHNYLTKDEETYTIKRLNKDYDWNKILDNVGTKRICENYNQECLATLHCEYCVWNLYLKANQSSGNDDIDNLIQNCQLETRYNSWMDPI